MKKSILCLIPILTSLVVASGCLRTRADIQADESKKELSDKLVTLQQSNARDEVRFEDYDSQFREMRGRIDGLEQKLAEARQERDQALQAKSSEKTQMEDRLKIYEEALRKLEGQMLALNQELARVKATRAAAPKAKSKKGNYANAEDAYKKKNWKSAIVGYQKYREMNPKGRRYASATYRIGVCFQELGMASDARAFFDEVIEKFPKSKDAKQARVRLKGFKK